MIKLAKSNVTEVDLFVAMESTPDTAMYVLPYTREKHLAEMVKDEVCYLTIYHREQVAGFIILAIEGSSVEFRRIVVHRKGLGTGQQAMQAMEEYCLRHLGADRIWLDVFAENEPGIHIYKKQGYQQFDVVEHNGRALLLFEKKL
ncbi:GNAT family N-acetyltransferase [Shewanella sp. FJAT-52076]|nr:GNAT family N-acetyltransferase [Shewanella sp. FJAT-52076]